MKRIMFFAVPCIALGIASSAFAQNEYYVQSMKAKVMSAATFKSSVLGEVSKGIKLISTGREGSWIKVKFNNKDGYVPSLLLAGHPPYAKTGVIKETDADIKQGVRRRASSYTSAAAARGLTQDERKRMSTEEKTDYEALEKIEAFQVRPDELARFAAGN